MSQVSFSEQNEKKILDVKKAKVYGLPGLPISPAMYVKIIPKALAVIYKTSIRKFWKMKKMDWLEILGFKKWNDSTFPGFSFAAYIFCTGCSTQLRNTSEQWFKTKSLKGCLLSLSNGSGNGNCNMTETFFDSNYPTSAKHHGLSHYCQQRMNMEHEHPHSPYNDKMPLFLPTRMVSEEAKWGVYTFTIAQRQWETPPSQTSWSLGELRLLLTTRQ